MEVIKSKHKTPKVSDAEMEKRRRAACMSWYGHMFTKCGYCSGVRHRDYVCSCGFQLIYNDDGEEVWSNQ